MPKILIVAATPLEIEPVLKYFKIGSPDPEGLITGERQVSALITGAGMVNTAYQMGRLVNRDFDLIINAGICGAFNRDFNLGDLVQVTSDTLSELGAEDGENFLTFESLKLGGTAVYESKKDLNNVLLEQLKKAKGITVNKVHGREESINEVKARYNPDVESMEGAAFFRACEHFTGPCLQIRAVSNYVEKRDKKKWNIPLAINNLNDFVIQFINSL